MKFFIPFLVLAALAGCTKSVNREGGRFAQSEPGDPTSEPSPGPTSPTDPVSCDPATLAALVDFAVYANEGVKMEGVKISKRVAATDAYIQSAEIGVKLKSDKTRADLVAGRNLGISDVKLPHGKGTYGGSFEESYSSAYGGFEKAAVDIAAGFRKVRDFSSSCNGAGVNAKVQRSCRTDGCAKDEKDSPERCTITIVGSSKGVNVAEISDDQMANVDRYIIEVPRGSVLVTNFPKTQIAMFKGAQVKSPSTTRLYWNFPAADQVEFNSTKFLGTVVAPDAAVRIGAQSGEGGYWSREFVGLKSNW